MEAIQKLRKEDQFGWFRRNIEWIVVVVGIVVAFTTLQVNQINLKETVNKNCADIEELKPMKRDIKYILETVQRMEERQYRAGR